MWLRALGLAFLPFLSANNVAPSPNSTVIAFALNEGFQFKLIAVLEKIRLMRHGRTGHFRLIAYDLGLKTEQATALKCASPPLLD